MGICLVIRRVTDEDIEGLKKHPDEILWFLFGTPREKSLMDKLLRKPDRPYHLTWQEPSEEDETDLDKAWHGIHFLLTGKADGGDEPACYLLAGGEEVGDVEVGVGPARVLTSAQTLAFHEYLQPVTAESLKPRYNPENMKELDLYPEIFRPVEEDPEPLQYLLEYFDILKAFVAKTAERKQGLLLYY